MLPKASIKRLTEAVRQAERELDQAATRSDAAQQELAQHVAEPTAPAGAMPETQDEQARRREASN